LKVFLGKLGGRKDISGGEKDMTQDLDIKKEILTTTP